MATNDGIISSNPIDPDLSPEQIRSAFADYLKTKIDPVGKAVPVASVYQKYGQRMANWHDDAANVLLAGRSGTGRNLHEYDETLDGVKDNTTAFTSAIADLQAKGGGTLVIPRRTVKVSSLASSIQVTTPITIVGMGPESVIDFASSTADPFDCRASLTLRTLTVKGWSSASGNRKLINITEATSKIDRIILDRAHFESAPDGWVLFCDRQTAGAADTLGVARVVLSGCEVSGVAWGVQLDTYNVADVTVTGCRFRDIEENAVWLGRDYAASLASFEGQGDYIVANNQFHRIGDGTVQANPDRHAVIAFGARAVIAGNTIEHVQNDTGNDCEGIYTKVTEAIIVNNTLLDAGLGQAFIAQKGLPRADAQTPGYNTVIAGNVLKCSTGAAASSAISIGVGECIVSENILDGFTDTAVVVGGADGDILDVLIALNRIVNTKSGIAVSLNCPGSRSVRVLDNLIDGVDGGSGNAVGVLVTNSGTLAYEHVKIAGNTIRNMVSTGGTHVCGVLDNMTQNPSVEDFDIEDNTIRTSVNGLKFSAGAPRHLRLRIRLNKFLSLTGEAIGGAANLLTTRTRPYGNEGFRSEASGSQAFDGSNSSYVITHGLDWTKRLERRILIEPNTDAGHWSITAAGATTFTVNFSQTPIAGTTFGWTVMPHEEAFS